MDTLLAPTVEKRAPLTLLPTSLGNEWHESARDPACIDRYGPDDVQYFLGFLKTNFTNHGKCGGSNSDQGAMLVNRLENNPDRAPSLSRNYR